MVTGNNHYKTSDTALASYLITSNQPILMIDYSAPRFEYHFPMSDDLEKLAHLYLLNKALVDPSAYSRVNKKLMRIIRRQVQWEED